MQLPIETYELNLMTRKRENRFLVHQQKDDTGRIAPSPRNTDIKCEKRKKEIQYSLINSILQSFDEFDGFQFVFGLLISLLQPNTEQTKQTKGLGDSLRRY